MENPDLWTTVGIPTGILLVFGTFVWRGLQMFLVPIVQTHTRAVEANIVAANEMSETLRSMQHAYGDFARAFQECHDLQCKKLDELKDSSDKILAAIIDGNGQWKTKP